jgi:hypothetical protein
VALPASRNRTYVAAIVDKAGATLHHEDLNDIFDLLIALGTRTIQFSPFGAGAWTGAGTKWTDADLGVVQSTTDTPGVFRIPLHGVGIGDKITSVDVRVHMDAAGHGANTLTASLILVDRSGIVSAAAATDTAGNANAAGMQTITITPAAPVALAALHDWILELTTGGVANHQVHSVTVHVTHPIVNNV